MQLFVDIWHSSQVLHSFNFFAAFVVALTAVSNSLHINSYPKSKDKGIRQKN